ncbi:MAG: hypothetical protein AAGI38_10710 [Bacteroidota bacterium]
MNFFNHRIIRSSFQALGLLLLLAVAVFAGIREANGMKAAQGHYPVISTESLSKKEVANTFGKGAKGVILEEASTGELDTIVHVREYFYHRAKEQGLVTTELKQPQKAILKKEFSVEEATQLIGNASQEAMSAATPASHPRSFSSPEAKVLDAQFFIDEDQTLISAKKISGKKINAPMVSAQPASQPSAPALIDTENIPFHDAIFSADSMSLVQKSNLSHF